ncbi:MULTISPECIES: hypothetical protein [unclassified Delftia]|uniref:hypothetical protein n=1 Tax=unclassified Delftia TaxID=2613839 RepID=UPI00190239FC|nr:MULTISPECIES: hypothetical protein [unclassified Delftia]MBK0114480.1 hypothetical protein [Delftia sp. S65]MBK0119384.1 hypothetical protein [Delftia sp. S67]MBK0132201.1 hypothetical protein [Delftia sp. S66]
MKPIRFLLLAALLGPPALAADLTVIEMHAASGNDRPYSLDGQRVSPAQLRNTLSRKLTAAPDAKSTARIAVLVDPDVKVGALSELRGLVMKVGFGMPRYFMTTRVNDRLSEIQVNYSPVFPRSGLEAVMSSGQPAADPSLTTPAPPR